MKSRNQVWEIILAGCLFSALGIYLLVPDPNSLPSPQDHTIKFNTPKAPKAPEIPKSINIHLEKIEKKLQKVEKMKELNDFKQLEKELQRIEKELERTSFRIKNMSVPSLMGLPHILIQSQ